MHEKPLSDPDLLAVVKGLLSDIDTLHQRLSTAEEAIRAAHGANLNLMNLIKASSSRTEEVRMKLGMDFLPGIWPPQ